MGEGWRMYCADNQRWGRGRRVVGLWGWSRRRNSVGEGGTAVKFHGNVVCNRKFNRREPGNSAGGER